jgi:uncharacterized protein (TIGR02996 family)
MDERTALLSALHANPADDTAWLALADALEEQGEADRAELTRLLTSLRRQPDAPGLGEKEARLRALLLDGVRPCTPTLENSLGMVFVLIPPGVFWMGSPEEESRHADERPRHRVEITQPFYLGIHPVTQQQYQTLTGSNPASFSHDGADRERVRSLDTRSFPVEFVSWNDATAFCHQLQERQKEQEAGRRYRLPTEAEWEYACRAGTSTAFWFGPSLSSFQANFDGEHPFPEYGAPLGPDLARPTPVGSYPANGFGLFDVHGNVWEWCKDWYYIRFYQSPSARRDPCGPRSGRHSRGRVSRGGAWYEFATDCRSAYRQGWEPNHRRNVYGFRLAITWPVGEPPPAAGDVR